ncbi:ankyrin [Lophiostoma macrostomum CBS 122681]|uniref:Ankyrin n=1 Tax=Lophiostoma macrostomum CBS 122681 TaxID=1314788 RepID=A0A6A6TT26_9PLEO|nr:ankyrin [Lophiostoma macrostomum CBS 122681]
MKSLSCVSLSQPQEPSLPAHRLDDSIDTYKDESKITVIGHKGPKIQTIIEVIRCDFARPGRAVPGLEEHGITPSKEWTPLHFAVLHNREAALLHFLRAGQSPDGGPETGDSPILVAVAMGNIEISRIICAAGANVNTATYEKGETPLHIAIKNGRSDMIDLVLSSNPDLNAETKQTRETPLRYAAAKPGCLAVVVSLLKQGANYEAIDHKGQSAAEAAFQASNIHAAVAIINAARGKRNKLRKEKDMLLRYVEKPQNRFSINNELIADIFEAGCDPDSTVLIEAIKRNELKLAEMFLGKGADPDRPTATGIRPIFAALDCAGAQMIGLLAKHNVDVTVRDSEGLSVLQAALDSPSAHDKEAITGIFDALISCKADVQVRYPDGKTLLHHVVSPSLGLAKVALRLLQNGVKVDDRDHVGNTALFVATHSRSCIEVLLKHRADVKTTNNEGLTPLLYSLTSATKEEEPDSEPLIKISDLRKTNKHQSTGLHIAAKKGLLKSIQHFLKYRAETTLVDSKNRTPLLLAVLNQQWHVVPLLATQPGINSWDDNGMTALHHTVTSIPKSPAGWKDIASATAKFCEKGVSRSMRDRGGATPLIGAVKTLPEEGLAVVEILLAEKSKGPRSNCVGHEDHKRRSALFFAATLEKPTFVLALLKSGAPFTFKDWTLANGPIQPVSAAHKRTLKLFAEHEWMGRARTLHRSSGAESTISILPDVLPLQDLDEIVAMGLDPNGLPTPPKTPPGSLLWAILNQTLAQPPLPPRYLQDILKLILQKGGDANAITATGSFIPLQKSDKHQNTRHPLTFLLEHYPAIDIDLITLFINHGANLVTASGAYEGRYPLHSAVQGNRVDVVDEFLIRRAEIDVVNVKQQTPLFIAAEKGFWEVADMLLGKRPTVTSKDVDGNTPLHMACISGSAPIVSSLLRGGAKGSVLNKNNKGQTPRSCLAETASEKDKDKIIKLLKNAEDQEMRAIEQRQKQLEVEAMLEGRDRLRKEREKTQRAASSTHLPSPIASSRPSAIRHLSSSILPPKTTSKSQPMPAPLKSTTALNLTTQQTSSAPAPTPYLVKPLPVPRVDSGVMYAQPASNSSSAEKPLPTPDANMISLSSFDEEQPERGRKRERRLQSQDEFAGWLALSSKLDHL